MLLPEIETERLLLRMYRINELEKVYHLCTDANVTKFFPPHNEIKKEDVLTSLPRRIERWRTQGFGQLGVFDKTDGELIGYCGLQYLDNSEEIEIYYGFFKDFWGKGLATEAAKAMLRFGFEQTRLGKIVAVTHPENTASQKVLLRLGLTREKNAVFYNIETCYFAVLIEDYKPDTAIYELNFQKI
jgi:ribosomal-protein-alanine N-acetyltransferase